MKTLILALSLTLTTGAFAATDYQCQSDCTRKGYSYSYCNNQCSYSYGGGGGRTDYTCQSDCTRNGYMYSYCKSKCSY